MDDEIPPWKKHGSHNSGVPYNTAGEHQESHDLIRDSFTAEEPISTLSPCMSGAFKSLLPDYPETSSAMTEKSVKYSYSPNNHCLIKPDTVVDGNIKDKSDFLKESSGEASDSVKHMLSPRCDQYVTQEKDRELEQGNCNWTSVIKDALEMSNGMEMEQTCGPVMDFNSVYKGPKTEAKFTFNDHYQRAGHKLNETQDGQEIKRHPDSFTSMLSDDSKKKDDLEMGNNEEPSILDVGSSVEKEELGITGVTEHEPGLLPGLNRSSYTPFSSSDDCFKHAEVNNETVHESSAVYGLHYLDPQKGQAEVTDGNISPPSTSVGSKSTAMVKGENSNLRILTEEGTFESSQSVPGKTETVFQEISINTNNAEFSLKVDTCKHSQTENGTKNELRFQENNSKNVTLTLESAPERTTDECDIQVQEKQTLASPRADLLPCDKKVQNSEKMEKNFLHITSQSSIPPPENVQAAPLSPISRTDCSPQHNLQNALQTHKKRRKRKISELEKLIGPIYKSNKDNSPVYGSEISVSAIKSDATGCEEANQNVSFLDHESTALKEQDLNTNGDANPSLKSLCHSQLQASQLGPVADTSETSQDHSCSEASYEKPQSTPRKKRKVVCKRKLTKKTKLHLKAKNSTTLSNQHLSQSTVLSPEDDCTSHSQVSDTAVVKAGSNSAVIQQATSKSEPSNTAKLKKSRKTKTLQTKKYLPQSLQSKGDPHEDVPTTFSEPDPDLDFKRHQKARQPSLKTSKGKNDKRAVGLPNTQSSLDSVSQTDSISTLVTESEIPSPQNSPNKARQKKRANTNKPTITPIVCPQEDIPLPLPQDILTSRTKTVKRKSPLKKVTEKDGSVTTLLDEQPSIAALEQADSVPTAGTEGEAPAVLSTQGKSPKKKLSDIKYQEVKRLAVDQTPQLNFSQLSESDVSVVQPTTQRFRTRKTLNKNISHDTACYEPAHLNELISSSATETCYSGVSQQNTGKTSSKRKKANLKFMEEQPSTTSQQEDITIPPSEDFPSIVASNPKKTVKTFSRNKTNANCLNGNLDKETSLLAAETQENLVSPSKIDTSSSLRQSNTLKKTKTVTSVKNEAEKMHEDWVAVPVKPGANMEAFGSQMTLEEKRPVEKAIRQEVMQTSTTTLQHTECASTSFAQSTSNKLKKKSDIKGTVVHTSTVDQTMEKEIQPFEPVSEEINIADVLQMTTKVKTKKHIKKVTKSKSHVIGSRNIREQSVPGTTSNRKTNSRSEDMTNKCMTKRTSALKDSNLQPEDHAGHPTALSALLPSPASLGNDATQGPRIKTDIANEKAESHVENQVSITTEASPHSSLKKTKKKHGKRLLEQKEESQSNVLELAQKEDKMSEVPSAMREVTSENFEILETDIDQNLKVSKKKFKKSNQIVETPTFANVSLIQDKNTGTDEAGVMVTPVQDFCKLSDGQTAGSQQPEEDDTVVDQKDLIKEETGIKVPKATKTTNRKSRKAGRKTTMLGGLLTQIVKEEECEDIYYDNRIECGFRNKTEIHISDSSQRTAVIQEEPVLKSRKSTRTQKINSSPVVEKLSTQDKSTLSLDTTECHTRLGETVSCSMQVIDCEDQYDVKQKPRRRGRPPKKKRLSIPHLKDNTSSTVEKSELSSCQDSTANTNKAAASPVKQEVVQPFKGRTAVKVNENVTAAEQLGADTSESPLQSPTDALSLSIPAPKQKKCERSIRNVKSSSLKVSSRTSETSVEGFQKAEIPSLPQCSTNVFSEEEKTSLPMTATKKQKLCEKTDIDGGSVLADIKIENKETIKVVKERKVAPKRRKVKQPSLDLATEQPQGLTTNTKNNKTEDYCEPAKSLLTKFSITNELCTEEQNNIVMSDKNDVKLSSAEMIPDITAGNCKIAPKTKVLCSSTPHLSFTLMKKAKRYKMEEHYVEPSGKDSSEVSVSDGASSGICDLIPSNEVKEESEQMILDPKMRRSKIKPLTCAQERDGPSVEISGKKVLNSPETENAFKPSAEQKVDGFTQESEDCVVKPNKKTSNRCKRSKPKDILKKPLTCKYCGISFRHITAYTIHQRIHTGDKPYKCKICGKTFAQLSNLKSHHNVHKQDTSFPCPCCSSRFLQKEDLLCHFKVHLQEGKNQNSESQEDIKTKRNILSNVSPVTPNKYGCLICKKNFVHHVKLQDHMQEHEMEKPLSCKDCGKKFWKQSRLAAHEKTHWPVKPYACSICGKGFNQLKALKKHSQDHAGETPFSCFHCGHAFNVLSALRMHQASKTCIARKNNEASGNVEGFIVSQGVDGQVNTPVFFKCQICKQLFRKWCQYTLHLQTHTSSPPYICFSCGQCYEKDSEMNVHCEVCCQSSGEEKICGASLSEIMQGVTETYPLKCTSSQSLPSTVIQRNSQTRSSSEQLTEPVQTKDTDLSKPPKTISTHQLPIKHPIAQLPTRLDVSCNSTSSSLECLEIPPSLWKFKCSRCGQRFEQYRTLSAHLQMHAPGFRYTCAHCGQFFERWSKLWLHQQRHRLKTRCYSCNQCNLQFRFFSSFKEHMIDHAGQRQYACLLCPKTFFQEASLHAHQCESHKLHKSLKCDVCSKTFSSLRNLIKHSLLHNGSTSHICLSCNLSFTNTRVLKEHLKTHITYQGPALPDIPSKPLDFPHKCKRCKASFSTGDLLYAHQIRHSRDAKTLVRPAIVPTSKRSDSCCNETPSNPPPIRRNHISNLKLDNIPNDNRLYVYSHPDELYVPPSRKEQIPVINLDPDEHEEASDVQNARPELPNNEIISQFNNTHLPQATSSQETTNLNLSESLKEMANGKRNYSHKYQTRSTFVETSVDMEVETPAQQESEESFECADCTEKLTSVLSLYEHYILHAMGDTYVRVH